MSLKRCGDYFLCLCSLILGSLICLLWAIVTKFDGSFLTFVTNYQTLISGALALSAALVTIYFLYNQIMQAEVNNLKQLKLQNLYFKESELNRMRVVSCSFSGEIKSLLLQIEKNEYLSYFEDQYYKIRSGEQDIVCVFPIYSNYFSLFDATCNQLGVIDPELAGEICNWYTKAKGFVDSIRGIGAGFYEGTDQISIVEHIINEINELTSQGISIISKLDNVASGYKQDALQIHKEIDSLLH